MGSHWSSPQLCQVMLHQTCTGLGCLKGGIYHHKSLISHKDLNYVQHLVVTECTICLKCNDCPCKEVLWKHWGRGWCPLGLWCPFHLKDLDHAGKRISHLRHPLTSRDMMWPWCMAHERPGTLGVLVFGWWQQWGWGAHVDAKIVVLVAAGHVVWIEQLTGFLDLSAW